jgi:uncharacterized membrane protein YoaK (UPF0700 family)
VLTVIWVAASGRPAGAVQYLVLTVAATAMGLQGAAFGVVRMGGVATTYLTGTLTGLVTRLVVDRRLHGPAVLVLVGLVVGAAAAGLLLTLDPAWAVAPPAVVLAAVVGVAALPSFRRRHAVA